MDQGETPKPNTSEQDVNPELSPQQKYESMLGRYVNFMDRIRTLERLHKPEEERYEVDKQRSSLHREMLSLGKTLGKDKDGVSLDILTQEGNLREYGIETPVLRLPIVGTYFSYDMNINIIKKSYLSSDSNYKPGGSLMSLRNGGEEKIVSWRGQSDYFEGDEAEMEKWDKKPYCVITFQVTEDGSGNASFFALPLNSIRLERMKNLARDFNLNLFRGDYTYAFHDRTGDRDLFGVEVPADRIDEIGSAMRAQPEKYWLTKEELKEPYKEEYLEIESVDTLQKYISTLQGELSSNDGWWQNWSNILRVFRVVIEKDISYNAQGMANFLESHKKGFNIALKNAKKDNPKAAEDMVRIKADIDEIMERDSH